MRRCAGDFGARRKMGYEEAEKLVERAEVSGSKFQGVRRIA
jgi:nicotinic acid phosphoribosyltransferase